MVKLLGIERNSQSPISCKRYYPFRLDYGFFDSCSPVEYWGYSPEGIVIITLLVVLVGDLIVGRSRSSLWTPYAAIAGLLISVGVLYTQWDNRNTIAFLGSFNGDDLSIVFRGIIAITSAVTILMSIRYIEQTGTALAEFIAILLTATLGAMFLSGANELVTIFVALETLSISSYLLTGYTKRDPRSNEAALKYLLIG